MSNNNVLSAAQQVMQRLKADYLAEMPERLNSLEEMALQLSHVTDFPKIYDDFYRKTHSLKGSAGTYGLPVISAICHEMEENLSVAGQQGKGDDALVDRCLGFIDLMRKVAGGASQGQSTFSEIEAALGGMRAARIGKRFTALLVEPSRVNTTLYLGVLKGLPVEFSVVESAYSALELLLHSRFDLVITGYETPMLNGAALIAAMRLSGGNNALTPSILITSNPDLAIPPSVGPSTILCRDGRIAANLLETVRGIVNQGKPAG